MAPRTELGSEIILRINFILFIFVPFQARPFIYLFFAQFNLKTQTCHL